MVCTYPVIIAMQRLAVGKAVFHDFFSFPFGSATARSIGATLSSLHGFERSDIYTVTLLRLPLRDLGHMFGWFVQELGQEAVSGVDLLCRTSAEFLRELAETDIGGGGGRVLASFVRGVYRAPAVRYQLCPT